MKAGNNKGTLILLESGSILSSLYLLAHGSILRSKALRLSDYNEIYAEYANIMLVCGSVFLVYTIILMFIERWRKQTI